MSPHVVSPSQNPLASIFALHGREADGGGGIDHTGEEGREKREREPRGDGEGCFFDIEDFIIE